MTPAKELELIAREKKVKEKDREFKAKSKELNQRPKAAAAEQKKFAAERKVFEAAKPKVAAAKKVAAAGNRGRAGFSSQPRPTQQTDKEGEPGPAPGGRRQNTTVTGVDRGAAFRLDAKVDDNGVDYLSVMNQLQEFDQGGFIGIFEVENCDNIMSLMHLYDTFKMSRRLRAVSLS